MKVAVYAGTRNIYKDMLPSAKSLLIHSDVDKIYFLIEDDEFPYDLPSEIECINVSNQTYFHADGPNFRSSWTYMVLMRAALSKIFPQIDTILSLDVDTIVNENISDLWDIDLENYYLAGAKEEHKSHDNFLYINMGVALFNLKKLREDHKDDEIIRALNTKLYDYKEQDCINELCQGHIYRIPSDYNINNWTGGAKHRKIIHYAAVKGWKNFPLVQKYRECEIIRNAPNKYGLDIIIPTYKNIKALEKTIKSVYHEEMFALCNMYNFPIQITVVDDCSNMDYSDLISKYPKVNLIIKDKNEGPGLARQTAINATSYPYILFVDTGDYILSKYAILQVILTILSNTVPYIYLWRWLNAEWSTYSGKKLHCLHGAVYNREFLTLYNIEFCAQSSYANEDVGFNRACSVILRQLDTHDCTQKIQFFETPIYMYTYDKNSITHANKKEYMYTKQLRGLLLNEFHVIDIGKKNNINSDFLWDDISYVITRLWYDFWFLMKYAPETGQENWELLRKYYFELYKPYRREDTTIQQHGINSHAKELKRIGVTHINFSRFINDLENEEYVPSLYFDFFQNS